MAVNKKTSNNPKKNLGSSHRDRPAALQEHACQALLESITQRQALQMPGDFHTIQAVIKLQAQLQAPEGAGQNHRQCMIEVPAERHAFKTIREGCPFQASVEIPSKGQSLQTSEATPTEDMNLTYRCMCMLSRAGKQDINMSNIFPT